MDREAWIRARRKLSEERMDTIWAPVYDANWGRYISASHQKMIEQFLAVCPPQPFVLDAACGTGKYWQLLLPAGCRVVGVDQSQQMLNIAHDKYPHVPVRKQALQELDEPDRYDGIICVDAMETIFPEHWPLILDNFYRALRPRGWLYVTVERELPDVLYAAYQQGRREGLPLVEGEVVLEGGYHYYPRLEQVAAWLEEAGFRAGQTLEGDGYFHALAQAA